MKKLLFAIAAVVTLSFNASASDFKPVTLLSIEDHSMTITNGATSNYTARVSVRGANSVGVGTKIQLNGSGTDGIIYKFKKSADGQNFETTPSLLVTNAAAGTTATYYFTKVDVSGCAAIELSSVVNGVSGQAITNGFVKIFPTP